MISRLLVPRSLGFGKKIASEVYPMLRVARPTPDLRRYCTLALQAPLGPFRPSRVREVESPGSRADASGQEKHFAELGRRFPGECERNVFQCFSGRKTYLL